MNYDEEQSMTHLLQWLGSQALSQPTPWKAAGKESDLGAVWAAEILSDHSQQRCWGPKERARNCEQGHLIHSQSPSLSLQDFLQPADPRWQIRQSLCTSLTTGDLHGFRRPLRSQGVKVEIENSFPREQCPFLRKRENHIYINIHMCIFLPIW